MLPSMALASRALGAAALWCVIIPAACAAMPSKNLVDACLRMKSTASVKYTELPVAQVDITDHSVQEDDKASVLTKKSTVAQLGNESFGIWETVPPKARGVVYNDHDIDLDEVVGLDRRGKPGMVDMDAAQYGNVHEGRHAFLCITYNAGEAPHNRVFGNRRGVYLIDRKTYPFRAYATVGDIRKTRK